MRTVVKVIGTILFIYGAAAPFVAMKFPVQMSVQWYLQVIGAIFFGALMILWDHLGQFKSILPNKTKQQLTPDQLEDQDIKYIYYLTRRAIDYRDEQSYALCQQLSDLFFANHHKHEIPTNSTSPVSPTTR